jgi:hypothetical protein
MSRIIIIFIFVVSLSLFAGIEKTNTVETEKLSNATNEELIASIKSETCKIAEKCKILSNRYYAKGKVAACDGKAKLSENYNSCADALQKMGDGLEKNKAELVSSGKENYKKAVDKLKAMSDTIFNSVDLNNPKKVK